MAHRSGHHPKVGQGTAKTFTYTVEIEDGVDTSSFGGDEGFARMVTETLDNPKSWTHNPQFAFQRLDASSPDVKPDFRVSLTSPTTVREGCGYEIPARIVLLQPGLRPRRRAEGVHQRPAGCAAQCPSRATSAPTGNT